MGKPPADEDIPSRGTGDAFCVNCSTGIGGGEVAEEGTFISACRR